MTELSKEEQQLHTTAKQKAFEWATDYKPWQYDLPYQDYARYGYEQGYLSAKREMGLQPIVECAIIPNPILTNIDPNKVYTVYRRDEDGIMRERVMMGGDYLKCQAARNICSD